MLDAFKQQKKIFTFIHFFQTSSHQKKFKLIVEWCGKFLHKVLFISLTATSLPLKIACKELIELQKKSQGEREIFYDELANILE